MSAKFMKYILSILFFLHFSVDNSFSQWYKVNSGVSSTLNSIFFKDNLNGWMCGFETVIRTTDGGITWSGAFLTRS